MPEAVANTVGAYSFTVGYNSSNTVTGPYYSATASGTNFTMTVEHNLAAQEAINQLREMLDERNYRRRELTPEEEAEQRRREEEREREYEEYNRQRQQAHDRSRELLISLLDPTQRETYEELEWFEVTGSAGNQYRIHRGNSGNIHWLSDGEVRGRLCAHPDFSHGYLPDPDVALAQMLALLTDEPGFIRLANVHRGERPVFGDEDVNVPANHPNYAA
jgi:hypothetical protein